MGKVKKGGKFNLVQPDLKSQGGKVSNPQTKTLGSMTRKGGITGPDLSGGGWVKGGK